MSAICPGSDREVRLGQDALCSCGQVFQNLETSALPQHAQASSDSPRVCLRQAVPASLPDRAPAGLPTPWKVFQQGNGHANVVAADEQCVAHVYCWSITDWTDLEDKIDLINGIKPKPKIGEVWQLMWRRGGTGSVPEVQANFDFEVIGIGRDLTERHEGLTHLDYVLLRDIVHATFNVCRLEDFRARFVRI